MNLLHRPDDPTDEPSPVRPYVLARGPTPEREAPQRDDRREAGWLRPYLLTGGRAHPLGAGVALGLLTVRRPTQRPLHNVEIVERVIRGLQAIA